MLFRLFAVGTDMSLHAAPFHLITIPLFPIVYASFADVTSIFFNSSRVVYIVLWSTLHVAPFHL